MGHDGGVASGDYCQSLDLTDVATGWTEPAALKNKAQRWVFEELKRIRSELPFDLLGVDSDNGSEFINNELARYCQAERIEFPRGRAWRKNDSCYVEQKNWSVVRRATGYLRYDTEAELEVLRRLYRSLRLWVNFFQPQMKLLEKSREGAKVRKRYDTAATPYQRVLASPHVPVGAKARLKRHYRTLNPAELKRDIGRCQDELLRLSRLKERRRQGQARSALARLSGEGGGGGRVQARPEGSAPRRPSGSPTKARSGGRETSGYPPTGGGRAPRRPPGTSRSSTQGRR